MSDIAGQPGAGWDEAQCTAALAHLEQLQAQIDDLRLAIPRIIEPFHRPPNPTTFKLYAQGVVSSQNGIKSLNEQWKNPTSQSTFEHVKKSYGANADLSASTSIPSHGWRERELGSKDSKKSEGSDSIEDSGASLNEEDISRIIVDFQKTHPKIKLDTQAENKIISMQFVSGSSLFKFHVIVEREANGQHKLTAECVGTTEPFVAITRCIALRPRTNDLEALLNMIAAYKTVRATSCGKCSKYLDATMLSPNARRCKQIAGANETNETVWEAFHESCLT